MSAPLVHRVTERRVTVRYGIQGTVEATLVVSDDKVREFLGLAVDDPIDNDGYAEYVLETSSEHDWELDGIDDWDRVEGVELSDGETRMVAPPAFVPLPGMEVAS